MGAPLIEDWTRRMTRLRWSLCLLILLWARLSACQGPAAALELTLSGLGQPTATLDGPWQFHTGDDLRWAAPAFDDSGWEQLQADKGWGEQGHFAYQGFAWYRRHLRFAGQAPAPGLLWLYLPSDADVYQVFWEGRLVGTVGKLPPGAHWPAYPRPAVVPLGSPSASVLALRVWRPPLGSFDTGLDGGLEAPPALGQESAIRLLETDWDYHQLRGAAEPIAVTLLYGIVLLASLSVWLQHREQPLLLWLGLLAMGNVLHANWWHLWFRFSLRQEALLSTLVYQPLADISTWFVLLYLLGLRDQRRLLRWAYALVSVELLLCLLDAVALWFWNTGWPQWLDGIVSELILVPELFPVVLVTAAIVRRRHLPVVIWLVAAFALFADLVQEVGAFFSQGSRFTHWTFWHYLLGPLFFLGGVGISLTRIADLLLLLSLIAAVYSYALRESRRERAIASEFHSAQELQRVLIPEDLPYIVGYEVTSAYRPALEVGGDFFQLIPQGGGSALLVVGDVSGKGLAAAMAVSLIVGTIRTLAEQLPSPAEMLAGINRRLTGKLQGGFATCIVVFLDSDGSLQMASAGHPGPFLNGKELTLPPALPLGLSLESDFEETASLLRVGDQLTLFSDGLLEARDSSGELFGFGRISDITQGCATASDFADAAVAFGQDDDITVVTVTRLRVGAEAKTSLVAPALVPRPAGKS